MFSSFRARPSKSDAKPTRSRLITLDGLPHTPEVRIEAIPLPRSGAEDLLPAPILRRLWTTSVGMAETVLVSPGSPVTVEGSNLDEVYARALAIARTDAKRGTLIVHLDLPDDDGKTLPLPNAYAVPDDLQAANVRPGSASWSNGGSSTARSWNRASPICMGNACVGTVAR